jgi:hypothetical protein
MSAYRLVTMQISPRAMTGCRECGASIIGPRGTATVRSVLDVHGARDTAAHHRPAA